MNTQDQDNQEVSARSATMTDHAKRCKAQEVDAEWTEFFILARDEQQFWRGTARHHLEPVYPLALVFS